MSALPAPSFAIATLEIVAVEATRRIANAEQMARFLADDLTNANAKVAVLSDQIDEMTAASRDMHRALYALAERIGVVQDLVRDGRTGNAINLLSDLIALAKRGRVQP